MRLDEALVARGLVHSTDEAARLVLAGLVFGPSFSYNSPGTPVKPTDKIFIKSQPRYVSRGGRKLEGALTAFSLDVSGLACLDIGASTGGFTDCLLQHGAQSVLAVDVGYGQFAWKLRQDARVKLLERTNAKTLQQNPEYAQAFDLAVLDVSFSRATSFMKVLFYVLKPQGKGIILIKPQFETDAPNVDVGGVVRREAVRQASIKKVTEAAHQQGFLVQGVQPAPLRGAKGNQEYLLLVLKGCHAFPNSGVA